MRRCLFWVSVVVFIRKEIDSFGKVVREAGLKFD